MATRKKGKSKNKRASAQPRGALSNVIDTGQQIWLAGLGAVARAQREGPKLFESLVLEGSEFQEQQRENIENIQERSVEFLKGLRSQLDSRTAAVRGKASETMDDLEDILQTRIRKALQQLGVPTSHEIDALARKVNELNHSVQTLTQTKSGAAGGRKRAAASSAANQQGAPV